MRARLRQAAAEVGLPFGDRTMTYNSRLAQELGKWAEDQGRGEAFHHAVFRAYFRDGANIARHEVLLQISSAIGLDPAAARVVLDRRSYRQAVDRDWQRSRKLGVAAVPTFILGGRRLIGAQTGSALEGLLTAAGVRRRPATDG